MYSALSWHDAVHKNMMCTHKCFVPTSPILDLLNLLTVGFRELLLQARFTSFKRLIQSTKSVRVSLALLTSIVHISSSEMVYTCRRTLSSQKPKTTCPSQNVTVTLILGGFPLRMQIWYKFSQHLFNLLTGFRWDTSTEDYRAPRNPSWTSMLKESEPNG